LLGTNSPAFQFSDTSLGIVFLGENMPPRIARMLKFLKRKYAVQAVLVCHRDGYNKMYSNSAFDAVLLFRNQWHLRTIMRNISGASVIHAFGPKSFYPNIARQFSSRLPFVYDMQDVLAIYFGLDVNIRWYQQEFPHERACLSQADGLVSHSLEPIPAYKIYTIKERVKKLYFPLYCDDDYFQPNNKTIENGEIHLVYAGEIQNATRDKAQFGNIQFHELINDWSAQKIHFHVYPAPSTHPLLYSEYKAIARSNPYFHLESPVPQVQLAKELSRYHFGVIPFFKTSSLQSHDKYRYSTALKLFNFIEAGIPVICSEDITFQAWIVMRYKAGFTISPDQVSRLRQIIEQYDYKVLAENLIKNREKLSLSKNIHRLYSFYERVIKEKNQSKH
jgi:hypothetical protein